MRVFNQVALCWCDFSVCNFILHYVKLGFALKLRMYPYLCLQWTDTALACFVTDVALICERYGVSKTGFDLAIYSNTAVPKNCFENLDKYFLN